MNPPDLSPIAAANSSDDKKGSKPTIRKPAPPELADLALIDAPRIAAAACISLSNWYDLVRLEQAPQPVIRQPRCTRWKLSDIRQWLAELAAKGVDQATASKVIAIATDASAAARAKRRSKAPGAQAAGC